MPNTIKEIVIIYGSNDVDSQNSISDCVALAEKLHSLGLMNDQALATLKQEAQQPPEKPSVWFYPKKGDRFAAIRQCRGRGIVEHTLGTWELYLSPATPFLRPERAQEWCDAMNLITSLRMECDEVTDEEQWVMEYDGALISYSRKEHKGADVHCIIKNTEAELRALLNKHGGAEKVLAALQTLGSR